MPLVAYVAHVVLVMVELLMTLIVLFHYHRTPYGPTGGERRLVRAQVTENFWLRTADVTHS